MKQRNVLFGVVLFVLSMALVACGGPAEVEPTATAVVAAVPTDTPVAQPTDTAQPQPTATSEPTPSPEPTDEPEPAATTGEPNAQSAAEEASSEVVEGDSGGDLGADTEASSEAAGPESTQAAAGQTVGEMVLAAFPEPPGASGDPIYLYGKVVDVNGDPLEGAAVEIWQTDSHGVYDHPGDPDTGARDPNFQFYGQSAADDAGLYMFRTILPGRYEPRPRHIHVKVKIDGAEVLTTQFYFEEDAEALSNEGLFAQAGSLGELLLLTAVETVDVDGSAVPIMSNDLVIDTGIGSGPLTPTPAQGQGPYYPLVTVADYDNDLTVVP